jgi:hypothetical protein
VAAEDKRTISIPQSLLVGILGLLVGGGAGGVVAPWQIQSELGDLRAQIATNSLRTAELSAQVSALRERVVDLSADIRDLRRGRARESSLVVGGETP